MSFNDGPKDKIGLLAVKSHTLVCFRDTRIGSGPCRLDWPQVPEARKMVTQVLHLRSHPQFHVLLHWLDWLDAQGKMDQETALRSF